VAADLLPACVACLPTLQVTRCCKVREQP
jgi:hypothetical protein